MSERRCALYRHWDQYGFLLYVGISDDPMRRTGEHASRSDWATYADRASAVWFDSRSEAEAAERAAIARERPIFNVAYGVDGVQLRIDEYLRFREAMTGRSARIEHEKRVLGSLMRGEREWYRTSHQELADLVVSMRAEIEEAVEQILEALRAIVEAAEGRDLTEEEATNYEKLEARLASARRARHSPIYPETLATVLGPERLSSIGGIAYLNELFKIRCSEDN